MVSPQALAARETAKAFRDAALGAAGGAPPTLEEMRAGAAMSMDAQGLMPEGVSIEEITVAGVPALDLMATGARRDRVLVYLHGGAYVLLSARSHSKLAAGIGAAAGCRVVSLDYRLAPEHPYPAAIDDALGAYRWLLGEGYAPEHIAIAGDSAGGGLTMATLLAIRSAGLPQPAAAVPLSPWVDLEGTGESMDTHAHRDFIVGREALQGMAALYVGSGSLRDPQVAPVWADLTGLPPLYIQVGGDETLLDDSTRLAANAARAGVEVRLDVFPEMQHVFQTMLGQVPESDDAVARIGAYLAAKLGVAA